MGCGQSKINIYPRKSKGKNNAKKSAFHPVLTPQGTVLFITYEDLNKIRSSTFRNNGNFMMTKKITSDKLEGEEEEGAENEQDPAEGEEAEGLDEDGKKKPARTKPITHVGGPLLAQAELSNSQQNFFKMLDEKIENGPDYDSNDEIEVALETARLHTLLKDWETASASSRSLPPTPRHIPRGVPDRPVHSAPKPHSRIPPNVIHQSYGVTPPISYRQNFNPAYQTHSPPHQYIQNVAKITPGIQYHQEYAQSYALQQSYPISRHYQHPPPMPNTLNTVPTPSPVHYQPNNSPKHHKYPQQNITYNVQNSPPHKLYVSPQNQGYTNGELIIQQQLYNQQIQYQQTREYQQYRQSREQLLVQQQICGATGLPPSAYGQPMPSMAPQRGTHYQSSVHVPIVAVLPQNEQSPKMSLQRKQRQYSQEMT